MQKRLNSQLSDTELSFSVTFWSVEGSGHGKLKEMFVKEKLNQTIVVNLSCPVLHQMGHSKLCRLHEMVR
jgi:hypothetical protein